MKRVFVILFSVLFADQALKIWVKTHLYLGQEFHVLGDWFIIHFTENEGMAFGITIGGDTGKLLLSLFRVLSIIVIFWIIALQVEKKAHRGFITSMSLILAGAMGNIIDSCFYGMLFSGSYSDVAVMFPQEGGYAGFLFGHVVDMFYFPVITGYFPDWSPLWSGEEFIFFRPVFNVADSAITTGVAMIIVFQKKFFAIKNVVNSG